MNETKTIGNWAYGEFVHFTARPVDGVADPHLHLHCFVFNAGLDPEDGWKALDIGGIKRDAPYFQAVFHSLLADRMAELGYGVRRTRQGWELDGVPDSVIAKFSRRTDEIEKLAAELGLKAGAEKDALGAKTRKRKCKDMTMDELREDWEGRLGDDERAALDRVAEGGVGGTSRGFGGPGPGLCDPPLHGARLGRHRTAARGDGAALRRWGGQGRGGEGPL